MVMAIWKWKNNPGWTWWMNRFPALLRRRSNQWCHAWSTRFTTALLMAWRKSKFKKESVTRELLAQDAELCQSKVYDMHAQNAPSSTSVRNARRKSPMSMTYSRWESQEMKKKAKTSIRANLANGKNGVVGAEKVKDIKNPLHLPHHHLPLLLQSRKNKENAKNGKGIAKMSLEKISLDKEWHCFSEALKNNTNSSSSKDRTRRSGKSWRSTAKSTKSTGTKCAAEKIAGVPSPKTASAQSKESRDFIKMDAHDPTRSTGENGTKVTPALVRTSKIAFRDWAEKWQDVLAVNLCNTWSMCPKTKTRDSTRSSLSTRRKTTSSLKATAGKPTPSIGTKWKWES